MSSISGIGTTSSSISSSSSSSSSGSSGSGSSSRADAFDCLMAFSLPWAVILPIKVGWCRAVPRLLRPSTGYSSAQSVSVGLGFGGSTASRWCHGEGLSFTGSKYP